MNEDKLRLLRLLTAQMKNDPRFMAYALDVYCKQQELDEDGLITRLAATPERIVRLASCQRPDSNSSEFDKQMQQITRYTSISQARLIDILKAVDDFVPAVAPATAKIAGLRQRLALGFSGLRAAAITTAALLIVLSIFAGIALRNHSHRETEIAGNTDTVPTDDSLHAAANRAPVNQTTNNSAAAVTNANPSSPTLANRATVQMAVNRAKIHLDDYPILRGASGSSTQDNKAIVLARRRYELLIELPEGSERGTYRVTITDEFGRPKVNVASPSMAGRQLRVVLNLSRLSQKNYMLCITHHSHSGDEEPPHCYELSVSDAGNITPPR